MSTVRIDGPGVTAHRFWTVAVGGTLGDVERLLAEIPAARQSKDPFALSLRGLKNILSGDVKGGLILLRRSVASAPDDALPFVTDICVPVLISLGELDDADTLIAAADERVAVITGTFLALRATVAACRGLNTKSRHLAAQAAEFLATVADDVVAARTLQRLAFAAFYRGDFDEAHERSLEAAGTSERIGAQRPAATAYSVLYAVTLNVLGDADLARTYAERIVSAAHAGGDLSLVTYGLVAQLGIAAETLDTTRYASIRQQLVSNPLHEQYRERFGLVLAEILANGSAGRFDLARAAVHVLQTRATLSAVEMMLCDALIALFDAGRWEIGDARRRAHRVLSRTAYRLGNEPIWETAQRRAARVVAACVCIIIGEPTRGRRALSRDFDPDGRFARTDLAHGIDEDSVRPLMRGYARLINLTCASAREHQPKIGLTRTEAALLEALPGATSIAQLAADLGKSKRTLDAQLASIYGKLGVSNRSQAVERARSLGIIA